MQVINRYTLIKLSTEKFKKFYDSFAKGEVLYKTMDGRVINLKLGIERKNDKSPKLHI